MLQPKAKAILRWVLAFFMGMAGSSHFLHPDTFVHMVPPMLPAPLLLVYISGVAELAGGIGLLIPRLCRAASWGLIALYVAVFPANVHMALAHLPFEGQPVPTWALWLRLPLQGVFIAWAYWVGKSSVTRPDSPSSLSGRGDG